MTLRAKKHHVMVFGRSKLMSERRSCEQKFLISRGLLIRLSTWALVYDMVEYFNYIDHRGGHIIDLLQLTLFFFSLVFLFFTFLRYR